MRTFQAAELTRMQATQETAMQDTCQILTYANSGADAYGIPTPSYTAGAALACGFEPLNPSEAHGTAEVPLLDGRFRLPVDTVIRSKDRIELTHRYGEALAASQLYELSGPVKRGPSGLVVGVKLVTTEQR